MDHISLQLRPALKMKEKPGIASLRISAAFMELLENQFPIDGLHNTLKLRSASDFAQQLHVHVNHLNRAVKAVQGQPTSRIISERILAESKRLLEQDDWNVCEVAYALGFAEVTNFNNFFKKRTAMNPTQFRKSLKTHR